MNPLITQFAAAIHINMAGIPNPTLSDYHGAVREMHQVLDSSKNDCGDIFKADRDVRINMTDIPNPTPADFVREARNVLDSLKYGCGYQHEADRDVQKIHDLLKMANMTADIQPPSTGYDLWALDERHDTDPLNGRSNAQMAELLSRTVKRFVSQWDSFRFSPD